jgi:hypothetical protein
MPSGYLNSPNPGDDAVPVTPSDAADQGPFRYLIVSVGGTLSVITLAGQTRNLTVPAGRIDIGVLRVRASGTAATGITGVP